MAFSPFTRKSLLDNENTGMLDKAQLDCVLLTSLLLGGFSS